VKIRFSNDAMRCRLGHEELQLLQSGRPVTLDVAMPGNRSFRASVQPRLLGDWQLQTDPTGIWLSVPRQDLELLAQSVPSRSGIEHQFDTAKGASLRVSLEVDVRDKPAPAIETPLR
jgi:hypothetical protein